MMTAQRDVLSGTPDEIAATLEGLSVGVSHHEYISGTQLRCLALELAKNPDICVSVVTYENVSQELEVRPAGEPDCEPVVIDRNTLGDQCQVTCDRWMKIGSGLEIEKAAEIISTLLRICVDRGRVGGSEQ